MSAKLPAKDVLKQHRERVERDHRPYRPRKLKKDLASYKARDAEEGQADLIVTRRMVARTSRPRSSGPPIRKEPDHGRRTPSQPAKRSSPARRAVDRGVSRSHFKLSLLLPLIALFALVLMPVLFLQLYFSFHQWTVYLGSWWEAEFVGFDLFQEVLTDPRFGWADRALARFRDGSTLGCFVFGFLLAYLMYKPFRGQAFYYIIFILPMLTVPIVVAYTAEMMLYQSGPINDIISRMHRRRVQTGVAHQSEYRAAAVTLLEIWNWTPFSFIIMLAGLSAIPKEPIEAAEILGASRWRIFWEVQLPLLRPVIFLALVLRFLEAMAEFPKTWALFQGGPGIRDGNTAGLHLPDDLAVLPDLQGRGDVLHRHDVDGRHRADGDPAAAAREARRSMRCTSCGKGSGELNDDKSRRRRITTIVRYSVLSVWAVVAFFPIYWMVSTSFKPDTQWFAWPPVYFPDPPTLANYLNVWFGARGICPDAICDLLAKAADLAAATPRHRDHARPCCRSLFGSVIAYGVSRYRILSEARMFQLLMLRMIPPIVVVAPLSLYYSALGLLDTMFGLDPDLLPHQPALRGVDDKELHRRGAARDRAGRGDSRRLALAHGLRNRPAADPLRPGGDVPVHPHPDLERIPARADHHARPRCRRCRSNSRNIRARPKGASMAGRRRSRSASRFR